MTTSSDLCGKITAMSSFDPIRAGRCWFFAAWANPIMPKDVASYLEADENAQLRGAVVIRSEKHIYVMDTPSYEEFWIQRIGRAKNVQTILMPKTALHKNTVSYDGKSEIVYSFGNFFGAKVLLLATNELDAEDASKLAGKHLADVILLRNTTDVAFRVVSYKEREEDP